MAKHRFFFTLLTATVVFCGAGCSGSTSKTYKVSGKVTLDGQPLPNASVVFIPIAADGKKLEGEGKLASGQTDSSGSFTLGTYSTSDGALPGDYKVTVSYSESVAGDLAAGFADKDKNMKNMLLKMEQAKKTKKEGPRFVVPRKYSDFAATPLKQTVPPPGAVEFTLKSK